ncbi:MAG: [LysW]-aminoadipate kinase [Thermomicrobiales bacterium]|nr:[LysW]-aminoadipate kinase [Thermomicrobiales bacterium]
MIVVKIGGGAGITAESYANFAEDLAALEMPVVLIHGGNAEFSQLSRDLGRPPRMVTNEKGRVSRYTDSETIDMMLMTYAGKVNKRIVAQLQAAGVNAVGLSAIDGRIATGRRKSVIRVIEDGKARVLRDDHAGTIEQVDTTLIRLLLDAGYLPVITPPALARAEGTPINVDGDKLSLELAIELGAEAIYFFSDTPGLLADKDDESTLIRQIDIADPETALESAQGRMKVKVESAIKAIERGVGRVVFSDARAEHPLQRALDGEGTVIERLSPGS